MTLKARRILYVSFVAMFLLAAPPLVLYTAGFRYDFEYNRLVETGSLVVRSEPEGATVRINGELREELTPTIINTILPGKIKLLVEKEGYHSWEKEVDIRPRVTAFEEGITLFAIAEPEAFTEHPAVQYWWNANHDKLAYVTKDNTLRLYNALNQKDTLIANVSDASRVALFWSKDRDRFFFSRRNARGRSGSRAQAQQSSGVEDEFILVETLSPERIVPLTDILSESITNVQWDPASPSALYALNRSNALIRINYLLATERVVAEGPILAYLAEPKRIVMISRTALNEPLLSWINPADRATVHLLPDISVTQNDELLATNSHYIAVRNPSTRTLSIVDPGALPPLSEGAITTIPGVVDAHWTAAGNTLVYSDGFGIYTRSFTTPLSVLPARRETSTLVTRYSKAVRELAITGNGRHAFYVVAGELRVSELNAASDPRSTTLRAGFREASGLRYNDSRNSLTFIDEGGILSTLALGRQDGRAFPFGD